MEQVKCAAQRMSELDGYELDRLNDAWEEMVQWPFFFLKRKEAGKWVIEFQPLVVEKCPEVGVDDSHICDYLCDNTLPYACETLDELFEDLEDETDEVAYYEDLAAVLSQIVARCEVARAKLLAQPENDQTA